MSKKVVLFFVFLLASVQIAWCKTERIVSLSPTATEMLFAIGAGASVVAVDNHSNFPQEVPLTELSALEPNLEAIASYAPDLVISSFEIGNLKAGLNAVGIEVLMLPAVTTIEGAFEQILEIGNITGNQISSKELVSRMRSRLNTIVLERKGKPKFVVYHELDENYYSPPSWSFLGDFYKMLGFENIADRADPKKTGYPKLSVEYILGADPEVIIASGTKDKTSLISSRPGWKAIKAVKNGAIITIEPDISGRWGPRMVDFCEQITKKLRFISYD